MKHTLNGQWKLNILDLNQEIDSIVPGSIYNDLLNNKIIPDPFYRTNEYAVREWMRKDYLYKKVFKYKKTENSVYLVCEGLDTLTEIKINGKQVSSTDNMHRRYRFLVTDYLLDGKNTIEIKIKSSIEYIEEKNALCPYDFYQANDAIRGFIHLRKAHSMFGWDWGPKLPDAGIWRDIYLHETKDGYIDYVKLDQEHENENVKLSYNVYLKDSIQKDVFVQITDPNHEIIYQSNQLSNTVLIKNPKLWWPISLGNQDLYQIEVKLLYKDVNQDISIESFGLKTSSIKREKDQYGESFTYVHNGLEVFLKGANFIIEDNVMGRTSSEKTKKLLLDAVQANHNAIRVWGGGLYPSKSFYDECDRLGLIVWQDFMFACAFYDMDDLPWVKTVEHEIKDNLKRLSNHPSLSILCGNNENETAAVDWNIPSLETSKSMYLELYENLIPKWLKEMDNHIPYWPSSPSSGGNFYRPNFDGMGDMHYWGVWHNNEPIEYYRKVFPRFMSEFGIQSFPDIETVKTYAEEKDFHIYSKVMKSHQKNKTANKKIIAYMRKMFIYPKKFEDILYVSQLIQAEGVRYGVEHFRRNYGRTMGSIYWQLNDCWPVASWSSIDYEGRWKALHYHSKKFYAPILISIEENKRSMKAHVVITNDTRNDISGTVLWKYETLSGKILSKGSIEVVSNSLSATQIIDLNLYNLKEYKRKAVLYVEFKDINKNIVAENMASFVQDKDLELSQDEISIQAVKVKEGFKLTLSSKTVKRFIQLKYKNLEFSDNFFHLLANQKRVVFIKTKDEKEIVLKNITIRSLIDTY